MNIDESSRIRQVVPNWRYFYQTLYLGELEHYASTKPSNDVYPIDEYISSWVEKKGVYRAGDLISAAIVNSQKTNPQAIEAAQYIVAQNDISNQALLTTAKYVMEGANRFLKDAQKLDATAMEKLSTAQDVRERIHALRQLFHRNPYNPIIYVDMARAYVSIGQMKKAENLIRLALWLDPNNRFIVRAAVRLMVHIGDFEKAKYILHKSEILRYDPWLMSAEIAINTICDKTSSLIKRGCSIVESRSYTPFSFTELSSSIGTEEMFRGSKRKSRDMFKSSLIAPNDNSLAQAEWAAINRVPIYVESDKYKLQCDYESKAYKALSENNASEAVHRVIDWVCDMPFSHKPVLLGSNLSMEYLKNFDLAALILEVGVKANPRDEQFLNNIAYAYARGNKTAKAREYMRMLESLGVDNMSYSMKVCIKATKGLIAYREKDLEAGNRLYTEAINMAEQKKKDDEELYLRAVINFSRERLIASGYSDTQILESLPVNEIEKHPEMLILMNEIIDLLKKQTLTPINEIKGNVKKI